MFPYPLEILEKTEKETSLAVLFKKEIHGRIKSIIETSMQTVCEQLRKGRTRKRSLRYNGSYRRSLLTPYGLIEDIRVPRFRSVSLPHNLFGKWQRRQSSVDELIIKLYEQGESYRDIKRFISKSYGENISVSTLTQITNRVWDALQEYHGRELSKSYEVVWLDAMHIPVRREKTSGGKSNRSVVLLALGYSKERQERTILDYRIVSSESYWNWRNFLKSLHNRGLKEPGIFVHDGAEGITSAIRAVYDKKEDGQILSRQPQQLCLVHLLRNIQRQLSDREDQDKLMSKIKRILYSKSKKQFKLRRYAFCNKYLLELPEVIAMLNKPMLTTRFDFDDTMQKFLTSTNHIERTIREYKRRLKAVGCFPNVRALEKLVFLTTKHINNILAGKHFP